MQNYSTQYSRVVPHHSTDWAVARLTSEIGRDPVDSGTYGRSWRDWIKITFIDNLRKPENPFPRYRLYNNHPTTLSFKI